MFIKLVYESVLKKNRDLFVDYVLIILIIECIVFKKFK